MEPVIYIIPFWLILLITVTSLVIGHLRTAKIKKDIQDLKTQLS